jgi:WD40 repeat protein
MPIEASTRSPPAQLNPILRALLLSGVTIAVWTAVVGALVWPYEADRILDRHSVTVLQVVVDPRQQQALVLSRSIPLHSPAGSSSRVIIQDLRPGHWRNLSSRFRMQVESLLDTPSGPVIGESDGVLRRLGATWAGSGEIVGQQLDGAPLRLACSADGRRLISCGQRFLYVWDLEARRLLRRFKRDEVWDVVLSSSGESFYHLRQQPCELVQRSTLTGDVLRVIKVADASQSLAISPDGLRLAILTHDGPAVIELTTGEPVWRRVFGGTGLTSSTLSFCPRGEYLVTASEDELRGGQWTVTVWNAHNGERRATFDTQNRVLGAMVSTDQRLHAWGTDGSLCQWDLSPQSPISSADRRMSWRQAQGQHFAVE